MSSTDSIILGSCIFCWTDGALEVYLCASLFDINRLETCFGSDVLCDSQRDHIHAHLDTLLAALVKIFVPTFYSQALIEVPLSQRRSAWHIIASFI